VRGRPHPPQQHFERLMSFRSVGKALALGASNWLARCGIDACPSHYYSALANRHELKTRKGWQKPSEMCGVDMDVERQIAFLKLLAPFVPEATGVYEKADAEGWGPGYGRVEALVLHGIIRYCQPRRVVEVGAGISSACILHALGLNCRPTEYTIIDPYPSAALRSLTNVKLIPKPVQDVGLQPFLNLQAGDFLFIDSSHAVKPASDVNFLVLEVLPRLAPGVLVQFHDIFFPFDYQPDLFTNLFQWAETTLLHAYLIGNARARVELCLSELHYRVPEAIGAAIPSYKPRCCDQGLWVDREGDFPASTYIATVS